jgi:hypothetical protein
MHIISQMPIPGGTHDSENDMSFIERLVFCTRDVALLKLFGYFCARNAILKLRVFAQ